MFVDDTDTTCICPPPHTEPTLTIKNLSNVLEGVMNVGDVAFRLGIPDSKRREMRQNNPNKRDHCQEVARYYVTQGPGATWLGVADALWRYEDYAPLETVNKVYIRGKTCAITIVSYHGIKT